MHFFISANNKLDNYIASEVVLLLLTLSATNIALLFSKYVSALVDVNVTKLWTGVFIIANVDTEVLTLIRRFKEI